MMLRKSFFLNIIRLLNKKQRNFFRALRLKSFIKNINKSKVPFPEKINKVLFVSTNRGLGDAVYIAGMANYLHKNNIQSSIVIPKELLINYSWCSKFEYIYIFGEEIKEKYDLIIDLGYVGIPYYKERLNLVIALGTPAVTINSIFYKTDIYIKFIDISTVSHHSQRLALISSKILGKKINNIYPYVELSPELNEPRLTFLLKKFKIAYINTIASDEDRCLSTLQLVSIANYLSSMGYFIIYNSNEKISFSNSNIEKLPRISFKDLFLFISKVSIVITPDTSVTHISSAVETPCLTIFPPNDLDFWPKYYAFEVWGPISKKSISVQMNSDDLKLDCTGYPNIPCGYNSDYANLILNNHIKNFIRCINENNI